MLGEESSYAWRGILYFEVVLSLLLMPSKYGRILQLPWIVLIVIAWLNWEWKREGGGVEKRGPGREGEREERGWLAPCRIWDCGCAERAGRRWILTEPRRWSDRPLSGTPSSSSHLPHSSYAVTHTTSTVTSDKRALRNLDWHNGQMGLTQSWLLRWTDGHRNIKTHLTVWVHVSSKGRQFHGDLLTNTGWDIGPWQGFS